MYNAPALTPGLYTAAGQASGLLRANESQYLLVNQFFSAGGGTSVNTTAGGGNPYASIAIQLERIKSSFYPMGVSLQCFFTTADGKTAANPGAFEIDLQTADIDSDPSYCTQSSLTVLNPSFQGRFEQTTLWAKYIRVYLKTITTACNLTVLANR